MFIKSIKTQALWDTGAVTSGISGRLADKLGLEVRERALLSTAAGCVPAFKDIVLLDLLLDDTVIPVKAVVVDDIPGDGNNFLIGMDVIQCGSLSIDTAHLEGNFHVCFKPYPGLFKSLKEMLGK